MRHYLGMLADPASATAGRIMLERSAGQRWDRLREVARDRLRERRHPGRDRMRALVAASGGRFEWREVPVPPSPGPDGAIVHPVAVASCDLDRPMGLGRTPFPLPMHFGHECVAEVLSVGSNVGTVRPGDRVVVPFQISCGRCVPCAAGLTANCLSVPPISMYGFGLIGGQWGGAYSDQLAVPFADGMLVPLPPGIDPVAAASVADNVPDGFRTVAEHLPRLLERDPDSRVLILSELRRRMPYSSSVPLYAGLTAKALGAREVDFVDRRPELRRLAETLGLQAHPPSALRKLPRAPLVVDATLVAAGPMTGLRHTAPDGVCVTPGSLHRTVRIPTGEMYGRNASYYLGRSHSRALIPRVLELMTEGRLHPELVTTNIGKLDRAPEEVRAHVLGDATKTILVE